MDKELLAALRGLEPLIEYLQEKPKLEEIKRTYTLHKDFPDQHLTFLKKTPIFWYRIVETELDRAKLKVKIVYKLGDWSCAKCNIPLPTDIYHYCQKHDPVIDLL